MEAYVWASTDSDLGVCISSRVFGSAKEAVDDAQECIGDACPITWRTPSGGEIASDARFLEAVVAKDGLLGDFEDSDGNEGHVTIHKHDQGAPMSQAFGWVVVEEAAPGMNPPVYAEWTDENGVRQREFKGYGNSGCAKAVEWWDAKLKQRVTLEPTLRGCYRVLGKVAS